METVEKNENEDNPPKLTAREKAAARRKRILESSQLRMNIVGEQSVVSNNEPEASEKPKKMGSARLQQMRRKRYKKIAEANESRSSSVPEGENANCKTEEAESNKSASEDNIDSVEDTFVVLEKEVEGENLVEKEDKLNIPEKTRDLFTEPVDDFEGKKYMGVARMRRKRLAEKKKKEEEKKERNQPYEKSSAKSLSGSKKKVNKTPVYLELLIIVILFLSGLDIGLQQAQYNTVGNTEVTFGMSYGTKSLLSIFSKTKSYIRRASPQIFSEESISTENDEFDEFITDDVQSMKEKNIDPLFSFLTGGRQIDLDDFTKGPGVILAAARVAVQIHRLLIFLFLFFPTRVIRSIFLFPNTLYNMKCKPVLFLVSMLIRQSGKMLGAGIPSNQDENKSKDILTVMTKTAMGFVTNSFPKLVTFYGILTHAKNDIYVVLCGFFLGLAVPLHLKGITGSVSDEL